jgi:alkylation response protein AidB-like acyl-CoA dehydrogenase
MDLDFSEEQEMLRETVRSVCEKYSPAEVVRKLEDDPVGYSADLWQQLGQLGLLGLTLPEQYGGSGMTMLDAAVVYEEFGRSLAPTPHFVSSIVCAGAILEAGSDAQKSDILPKIAGGETILTPAWLEPKNGYGAKGVQMRAAKDGDAYVLNGVKRHVLFASSANQLVVLARTGDGEKDVSLLLVDRESPGLTLTQQMTIASDTQYRLDFADVRVPAANRIGVENAGWAAWDKVMHDAIILAAAQAMGGAEKALEMTVQYSLDREQFGKPLGAFQALSHYMADASVNVDGGKTLVYEAAWAQANGKPIARLAPMAKLFACQTYRDLTAMAEQIHGGMGFTIEYDIQLYFRRAKQLQLSWWDSRYLEELIAADVLDQD